MFLGARFENGLWLTMQLLLLVVVALPNVNASIFQSLLEKLACANCGINAFGSFCCIRRSQCCHYSGRTFGNLEDSLDHLGKQLGILPPPDHL